MDNQKKYNIEEEVVDQMINDNSDMNYNVTIPVTIPTMGGYTFDSLKRELTKVALQLVMTSKDVVQKEEKHYTPRLQRLKALSRNSITSTDVKNDDRLAYLLNK